VEDGMQSPEFNLNASFVSNDGELFFGGMNGLNAFFPDSLRNNPYVPPIVITSAYKMKKGVREYINVEKTNRLVLPHNENSLTIEFSALEFTQPSKNRYMYHFEGMDEEWVDIGTRRFVSFYNLSSGEYRLRIRGSNNDGLWNEQGTTMHIVIKAPWWMSDLALISYILIAILLVYIIFKRRERKHLHDKKILEEKVSERTRRIEEQKSEILQKNKELHELNASKDKFFSIIAHDLRNPFNTIIGLSEVLLMNLENTEPIKIRKSVENIRDSSHQAHELLENLLLWARSHTGTMVFHPEPVDMRNVIEEGLNLVNAHAAKKNISLSAEIKEEVVIPADVNMIRTIFRNLLTNALKFTPQNGMVMVGLSATDGFCCISVKDNGLGINRENLKKLFEIDSSHKTKGTDKEPGTGLGLILCQEFISRHGGRIEVESEPGKGSEFRVLLPLEKNHTGT
jgi:signal transduction histidine kinase